MVRRRRIKPQHGSGDVGVKPQHPPMIVYPRPSLGRATQLVQKRRDPGKIGHGAERGILTAFLVLILVTDIVVFVKPPGHREPHQAAAPPATSGQEKFRQSSLFTSRFEFTVLFEK